MRASRPPIRRTAEADRRGIALPTAIFSMLMLSLLGAAIWTAVEVSGKSGDNRWQSVSAMQLAEAGAAHGLAVLRNELADSSYTKLLRGSDGLENTSDDGRLTGYGLASGVQIPSAGLTLGNGTYTVQIVDDPADGDGQPLTDDNDRVILRCTGATTLGGSVTIDAVIGEAAVAETTPGILVDGLLMVSGNPEILGSCGMVHANDDISVSGDLVINEGIASTGDVNVSGSIEDPGGDEVTPEENADAIAVPVYSDPTATHCGNADYNLQANGWVLRLSDNTLHDARSDPKFNWKRSSSSPVVWETASDATTWPGTFCAFGNVKIGNNMGESTGTPFSLSIIANGSIEISGNPILTANDEDGVLLMARGDVKISGNPVGSAYNYDGLIYARDQCEISGNPVMHSQIMCADQSTSAGVNNLIDENKINGNMTLTYDCEGGGGGGGDDTRRVVSWSQRFN